jgi:probable F420-dependent oxidoreductase
MKVDGTLSWDEAASLAGRFERQGMDGAISTEGAREGFFPLLLAGQATERLELMTGVAIAFARNPMIIAQQANDLQKLVGGRFLLGIGPQIRPHIENRFSMTWSRPAARMREFVLAIRAIWDHWAGGDRLDFRGEFYTHTLMTPTFDPGPNPHGFPPILMAGVGERMVEVAGEVADGLLVHPLNSPDFIANHTMPALERGAARAGRSLEGFQVAVMSFCMMGSNDEEIERARQSVRMQMSFYGSTPAYRPPLDHHGWGDLQPELNRLSKQGGWAEMSKLISDDMLDTFGVSGTPTEIGRNLRVRNSRAQRTNLMLVNETDTEAVSDLVGAIKER